MCWATPRGRPRIWERAMPGCSFVVSVVVGSRLLYVRGSECRSHRTLEKALYFFTFSHETKIPTIVCTCNGSSPTFSMQKCCDSQITCPYAGKFYTFRATVYLSRLIGARSLRTNAHKYVCNICSFYILAGRYRISHKPSLGSARMAGL